MKKGIGVMVSFWRMFRIIFVVFFLYLLGDAFYRWDGFRYYARFSEFIPAVALASILWGMVALCAAWISWLVFGLLKQTSQLMNWRIRHEHLLFCMGIIVLLSALIWKVKRVVFPDLLTSPQLKLVVFICVVFISLLLTWLFIKRIEQWVALIQERITPLVWLFGIWVVISVPIVTYHTWFKGGDRSVSGVPRAAMMKDKEKPNIILVTFDAMTARRMSLYGYHRETTPFISEWAKDAIVFTRAESDSNFTTSATTSLMTGKRVWTHRVFQIDGSSPLSPDVESLPAMLKKNGYLNMAFIANPHTSVETLRMDRVFDIAPLPVEFGVPRSLFGWKFGKVESTLYRLFGSKIRLHNWLLQRDFILDRLINIISRNLDVTEAPPDKLFNSFLERLDKNPHQPFFAWLHILPPHDPYLLPESYRGLFSTSSGLRDYKTQEALRVRSFKYLFKSEPIPEDMEEPVAILSSYYDEFIRYCDETYRDFIKGLMARNKTGNTVIILSSDHGESFEHGYFTHGGPFLYEQVTHIPLIIKLPDQTKGMVIDDLVEQIDITATILDLAHIPVPPWMEGRSLLPLIQGERLPPKRAFSMNFEENPSYGRQIKKGSIAVWEGDYKLIHYLERNRSLLFDLSHDPDELNDISDERPEISQRLIALIQEGLQRHGDGKE